MPLTDKIITNWWRSSSSNHCRQLDEDLHVCR